MQSELDATEYNAEVLLTELRAGVVEDDSMTNTQMDSKQQQRAKQREQYNTQSQPQPQTQRRERPEGATITPTTAAFSLSPGAPSSETHATPKASTDRDTDTETDAHAHTQHHTRDHGIHIAGLFCKATYSHDPTQTSTNTPVVNPRRILRARAPASVPFSIQPSAVPLSVPPHLLTPQPSSLGLGGLRLPAMTPTTSVTALPDVRLVFVFPAPPVVCPFL